MERSPLSKDEIGVDFQEVLSTQRYGPSPTIEGLRLIDLRLMVDDGGSFTEVIRVNDDGCLEAIPDFKVRQTSYSLMLPGSIKAFHLHYRQEDVWFIPPTDRLLVGLFDARAESSSYRVSRQIVLGGGRAQLLYIPRGVAHGAANLGLNPVSIVYFVNQQFDISDPDERRLPWDILGTDFWSMKRE